MGACCSGVKEPETERDREREEMDGSAASEVDIENQDTLQSKPSLQHISDREDLTSHEGTLFSARKERRKSSAAATPVKYTNSSHSRTSNSVKSSRNTSLHPSASLGSAGNLTSSKRYSSCGTIFLADSTVSQPNLKVTLQCVAIATHLHVISDDELHPDRQPRLLDIFDEKLHPMSSEPVPADYDRVPPEQKHVYKFLKVLFSAAKLTAECAIITLIYLERLLHYAEIDLHPSNWKWILLGSVLLASKVRFRVLCYALPGALTLDTRPILPYLLIPQSKEEQINQHNKANAYTWKNRQPDGLIPYRLIYFCYIFSNMCSFTF